MFDIEFTDNFFFYFVDDVTTKYDFIMQKYENFSKTRNLDQNFSKLNGSIFLLKIFSKLIFVTKNYFAEIVSKSYRNVLKMKLIKQNQSLIPLRAYFEAP